MKKVLFVATFVKKHIMAFHIPYLEWFKQNGYEVHVCSKNDYENEKDCCIPFCDKFFNLSFERIPFKLKNISVYKQLKKIIESNEYEIIHCHTPMGGALARLAARKVRKKGTCVIYTAHGFYFYKGSPIKNWLIYYPIEWFLSRYTDVLITINKEDYNLANKQFKIKKIEYVQGVGVNIKKFSTAGINKEKKRIELGIPEKAIVLLSVGELNKNKNHELIIRAVAKINNPSIYYVICGVGGLEGKLKDLAIELGIEKQFKLLGFRNNMENIYKIADIFVFPSYREGLPLSIMESMAAGLPVICSNIRGNNDLIQEGKGGYLVYPDDVHGFAEAIEKVISNDMDMGKFNVEKVKEFDLISVKRKMEQIYLRCEKQHIKKRGIMFLRSNPVDPDSRVEKEVNTLIKNGYDVKIIGWDRSEKYKCKEKILKLEHGYVKIYRLGIPASFGGGFKSNLKPLINFQFKLMRNLVKHRNEYDLVHACDLDTALTAFICSKLLKKKLIYDIFDYYVQAFSVPKMLKKSIESLDHKIINNADGVIICTEKRREQIIKTSPKELVIIHNTPPIVENEFKTIKLNQEKVKIVYVGILAKGRFIKEIGDIVKENKNYELHIGGFGELESYCKNLSDENENIIFYGKLEYRKTLELENSCDIMTAIYDPSIQNHHYAAPNKFYESLMLGKPVIMAKDTGVDSIVLENEIGQVIDYNKDSLVKGIDNLVMKRDEWADMAKKMKKIYINQFSWGEMEDRLLELYSKIYNKY
ncbi:glycosyltransferase [Clostridium sp. SHJSY1]|uniref:glycosyltransferase n=1 Tax=Clostridium sp. SHJSY1 TaxID=2942483 RepID=UPI002875EDC5|nr:glycosyltransferase [Clostridium sp. SHJSY1]MDS0526533.1 glycosyltransferase [Clostridium sp. SHJSY1]